MHKWRILVCILAALVVGVIIGRNTGGTWRVSGTGPAQIMYNEHTGETRMRSAFDWAAPAPVPEKAPWEQ